MALEVFPPLTCLLRTQTKVALIFINNSLFASHWDHNSVLIQLSQCPFEEDIILTPLSLEEHWTWKD